MTSNGFKDTPSQDNVIIIDSVELTKAVRPGDIISFNDGNFGAVVISVDADNVRVQFKEEGTILPDQTIRIPGHRLSSIPILRPEDKNNIIELAVGFKMDFICVPNVTSVKDIQDARNARSNEGQNIGVIAKIDNLEAVHQFTGILKHVDGVIVLRNELAFEL